MNWIPVLDSNTWWTTIILFIVGYLIGTFLIFRLRITLKNKGSTKLKLKDGSFFTPTSFGTSNAAKAYGIKFGILTFFLDFSKPMIFWFCFYIPLFLYNPLFSNSIGFIGLLGLLLGHNFPIWWKFRGGDGVVVSLGAIYLFNFPAATIGLFTYIFISAFITNDGIPSTFWAIVLTLTINSNTYFINAGFSPWYAKGELYTIWMFWFTLMIVSLGQIYSAQSFSKWSKRIIFKK